MIKNETTIRIAVIGSIALVIAGMWFIKNYRNNPVARGPLHLVEAFDLDEYLTAGVPVIIDFGADSCIPCKEMAPVLEELHAELQGKAIIRFVDVWKNGDLAQGFPIRVIPTQIFFDAEGNPFTPSEHGSIRMTVYKSRDTDEHVFTTHEGGLTKDQLLAVLAEMGLEQ